MKSRIALLGWGSLIWDTDDAFDAWHGPWQGEGPSLRVEFSRISKKRLGALTLVIDPTNGAPARVAWSMSRREEIDEAVEDLRKREGTPTEKTIGRFSVAGEVRCFDENSLVSIRAWSAKQGFDGVVWTDLRSNFTEKVGEPFSVDAAMRYLIKLRGKSRAEAFRYIRSTPPFVQTPFRDEFNIKFASLAAQTP